jgi:DNA-directed RNA polymerase sigma subunit (sigma70/sigma32)
MNNKSLAEMTQQEVADKLGISRVRVRQLEERALKKLRNNKKLKAYFDQLPKEARSWEK